MDYAYENIVRKEWKQFKGNDIMAFYLHIANKYPDEPPMAMNSFMRLLDKSDVLTPSITTQISPVVTSNSRTHHYNVGINNVDNPSYFTIDGSIAPRLIVNVGETCVFHVNTPGYPFYIVYGDGNNSIIQEIGDMKWTPDSSDIGKAIYYKCTTKDYMGNKIRVRPKYAMPSSNLPIYVLGPISLREWISPKYGIHAYIFGDIHKSNSTCPENIMKSYHIADFIQQTINDNQDKVIDFFLETDYMDVDHINLQNQLGHYLGDLQDEFTGCFQSEKSQCPDKRTRFHYADIRVSGILLKAKMVINVFRYTPYRNVEDKNKYREMIDDAANDTSLYDNETIMKETRINKQLDNIADVDFRGEIRDYFLSKIAEASREFKEWHFKAEYDSDSYYDMATHSFLMWAAWWVDFYTIARIFRQYTRSRNGYSNSPASNIIYYMGDAHAARISQFFEMLSDFKLVSQSESKSQSNYQCLRLNSKYPFFNGQQSANGPWSI